jgi:Flp pilus assembly pilin Flp
MSFLITVARESVGGTSVVRNLLLDDSGQDIVEYALLTAIIGIAAIAIWNELTIRVGLVYTAADTGVQNLSACTPDPGQVSCAP